MTKHLRKKRKIEINNEIQDDEQYDKSLGHSNQPNQVNQSNETINLISNLIETIINDIINNIDIFECPICYEKYSIEHKITTKCNHIFCQSCYDKINICAMCRTDLAKNEIPQLNNYFLYDMVIYGDRYFWPHSDNLSENLNIQQPIQTNNFDINIIDLTTNSDNATNSDNILVYFNGFAYRINLMEYHNSNSANIESYIETQQEELIRGAIELLNYMDIFRLFENY